MLSAKMRNIFIPSCHKQGVMNKKYFTPEQANEVLPTVKPIISRLMKVQAALQILQHVQVSYEDPFQEMAKHARQSMEFHRLSYELFKDIEMLMSLGCVPKDVSNGLVDFYSLKEGQEILLCWKAGEEYIDYWHDLESGYAGRRLVSELYEPSVSDADEF